MKAFFEQKLIALERDINWVMHFKDSGQEDENQETSTIVTFYVSNFVKA
jgi:hypothetical protein